MNVSMYAYTEIISKRRGGLPVVTLNPSDEANKEEKAQSIH